MFSSVVVPAVIAAPKVHGPPKVPLKPGTEDQEVYGSVDKLFRITWSRLFTTYLYVQLAVVSEARQRQPLQCILITFF